jgi:hypothetical protein
MELDPFLDSLEGPDGEGVFPQESPNGQLTSFANIRSSIPSHQESGEVFATKKGGAQKAYDEKSPSSNGESKESLMNDLEDRRVDNGRRLCPIFQTVYAPLPAVTPEFDRLREDLFRYHELRWRLLDAEKRSSQE